MQKKYQIKLNMNLARLPTFTYNNDDISHTLSPISSQQLSCKASQAKIKTFTDHSNQYNHTLNLSKFNHQESQKNTMGISEQVNVDYYDSNPEKQHRDYIDSRRRQIEEFQLKLKNLSLQEQLHSKGKYFESNRKRSHQINIHSSNSLNTLTPDIAKKESIKTPYLLMSPPFEGYLRESIRLKKLKNSQIQLQISPSQTTLVKSKINSLCANRNHFNLTLHKNSTIQSPYLLESQQSLNKNPKMNMIQAYQSQKTQDFVRIDISNKSNYLREQCKNNSKMKLSENQNEYQTSSIINKKIKDILSTRKIVSNRKSLSINGEENIANNFNNNYYALSTIDNEDIDSAKQKIIYSLQFILSGYINIMKIVENEVSRQKKNMLNFYKKCFRNYNPSTRNNKQFKLPQSKTENMSTFSQLVPNKDNSSQLEIKKQITLRYLPAIANQTQANMNDNHSLAYHKYIVLNFKKQINKQFMKSFAAEEKAKALTFTINKQRIQHYKQEIENYRDIKF